jgi:hypothetical protein
LSTNLFVPKLRAHKLSAAVGSGKTRAAIAWIASPKNAARNVLYVAPTQALIDQTAKDLRAAIAAAKGAPRNVHVIHSMMDDIGPGQVRAEALQALDSADEGDGAVLLITTTTFLQLAAKLRHSGRWTVVLDEAFKPVEFDPLNLGLDALDGWAHLCELFAVDPQQGYRLLPREGRKGLIEDVAAGHYTTAGDRFKAYEKAAQYVANPAMRCELVLTDGAKALLAGEPPKKRKKRGGTEETGTVLQFATYVDPQAFTGFREVLFLSALFEETILCHLWVKALGVTFEEHPDFPSHLLRDTHAEQGRFLAVGHLLHKDDRASLENLQRNVLTGAPGETKQGLRVIDHLVQAAAANFGEEVFLLQSNERFGYRDRRACVPRNAEVIPTMAHGLNSFQGVNNVAALAVCNPVPQEVQWLKERTGMTGKEVTQAYRIHSIYQALGRCSIRKAELSTDPKTVLVVGFDDARFIRDLFPGSHWLGQVGSLPTLQGLQEQTATKEPGKAEALAAAIVDHLKALPDSVVKVKAGQVLRDMQINQQLPSAKGATERFDVSQATWRRAVSLACVVGQGWQKQGHSLHRLTAAHYGFTAQS